MTQIRSHGGLRGLAALLVVAYHLQYRVGHLPIEDMTTFFRRSYLMVDLFFVLSGFIIAYVYDVDSKKIMTLPDVRVFILRRVIRIYPLHILVLASMVVYALALTLIFAVAGKSSPIDWSGHSLSMLSAQVVLLNAWLPGPNAWNIPSWSISAEFFAYLLFPGFVYLFANAPRLFSAAILAFAVAFYLLAPDGMSLDITGGVGAPLRCLAGFAAGFLLHAYRHRFAAIGDRALSVGQLLVVAWIFVVMIRPSYDSLVIPAFVLLVGLIWTDRGVVARALGAPRIAWLGDISYAVYITHVFVLGVLGFFWDRSMRRMIHDPTIERCVFIVVGYAAVILVSHFAYRRFEKPMRSMLSRRWCPPAPRLQPGV